MNSGNKKEEKYFVDPNSLYKDSFTLAKKILESGFYPNILIAVWRGGPPVGCVVHEYMEYCGFEVYHYPVKVYPRDYIETKNELDMRASLIEDISSITIQDSKILVVDDIFETGMTIYELLDTLSNKIDCFYRANTKIATIFYKERKGGIKIRPDFFVHQTNRRVVFPHELQGLDSKEISVFKKGYFLDDN